MLSTKSVLKRSRWSRSRASRKQSTSIVEYPVWKRGDSNYYRAAKLHCSAMLSQFHCTYTYTRRFWIILHAQWTRSECERRRPTGALSSNGGSQVRTFTPAISEDRHEGKNKLTWYACIHIPCVYTWKEREREREKEREREADGHCVPQQYPINHKSPIVFTLPSHARENNMCIQVCKDPSAWTRWGHSEWRSQFNWRVPWQTLPVECSDAGSTLWRQNALDMNQYEPN